MCLCSLLYATYLVSSNIWNRGIWDICNELRVHGHGSQNMGVFTCVWIRSFKYMELALLLMLNQPRQRAREYYLHARLAYCAAFSSDEFRVYVTKRSVQGVCDKDRFEGKLHTISLALALSLSLSLLPLSSTLTDS